MKSIGRMIGDLMVKTRQNETKAAALLAIREGSIAIRKATIEHLAGALVNRLMEEYPPLRDRTEKSDKKSAIPTE